LCREGPRGTRCRRAARAAIHDGNGADSRINAVSVSYGESKDIVVGFKDKGFQIAFNHNLPKAKVDLYAGLQGNTLYTPTGVASVDDIYTLAVGTKLKFD